jgi:hypothetical protein
MKYYVWMVDCVCSTFKILILSNLNPAWEHDVIVASPIILNTCKINLFQFHDFSNTALDLMTIY